MTAHRLLFAGLALACAAGCIHDDRETRTRDNDLFNSVPEVKAPRADRCAHHQKTSLKGPCEDARFLAQNYARGLSVGDEVCLEGGFGELPTGACLARAAVVDTGTNRALLEIRDARPESRWFKKVEYQVWFEEGALVDLYLAERGY